MLRDMFYKVPVSRIIEILKNHDINQAIDILLVESASIETNNLHSCIDFTVSYILYVCVCVCVCVEGLVYIYIGLYIGFLAWGCILL